MTAPTPSEVTDVTAEDSDWDWLSPALERADAREEAAPRQPGTRAACASCGVVSAEPEESSPAPRVAVCALRADSDSARQAREFTRATLLDWTARRAAADGGPATTGPADTTECDEAYAASGACPRWSAAEMGRLCDDVELAVSELVSNAIRHGMRDASGFPAERIIRLGLVNRGVSLLCAVTDPSRRVPVPREPDFLSESGRGLHVIASVSGAWGWTPPDPSGKVVWATFATPHCC